MGVSTPSLTEEGLMRPGHVYTITHRQGASEASLFPGHYWELLDSGDAECFSSAVLPPIGYPCSTEQSPLLDHMTTLIKLRESHMPERTHACIWEDQEAESLAGSTLCYTFPRPICLQWPTSSAHQPCLPSFSVVLHPFKQHHQTQGLNTETYKNVQTVTLVHCSSGSLSSRWYNWVPEMKLHVHIMIKLGLQPHFNNQSGQLSNSLISFTQVTWKVNSPPLHARVEIKGEQEKCNPPPLFGGPL
jgi:hypothetical protein